MRAGRCHLGLPWAPEPVAPTFHGLNAPGPPASGPLGAHSGNSHGLAWQGATGSDPATCHSIRRLPPPPRVGRAGADPRAHCRLPTRTTQARVTAQCPPFKAVTPEGR